MTLGEGGVPGELVELGPGWWSWDCAPAALARAGAAGGVSAASGEERPARVGFCLPAEGLCSRPCPGSVAACAVGCGRLVCWRRRTELVSGCGAVGPGWKAEP